MTDEERECTECPGLNRLPFAARMRGWSRCRTIITTDSSEAVKDGELWKLWYTFIPTAEDMRKEIDRRLGLFRRRARCCRSRCSMPTARSRA